MAGLQQFFDFSPNQLKFVSILSLTALLSGGYLLIRSFATPTDQAIELPVLLSDDDHTFTGLFQLDPNTAPADSLELLPGIGKTLADRIVAYRQHRTFERPVDLANVHGIGSRTFEKLRPYIRIRR